MQKRERPLLMDRKRRPRVLYINRDALNIKKGINCFYICSLTRLVNLKKKSTKTKLKFYECLKDSVVFLKFYVLVDFVRL